MENPKHDIVGKDPLQNEEKIQLAESNKQNNFS